MAGIYTPHLFSEMDPTCKFKHYLVDETGRKCKKPYCEIGFFECQWIDNRLPCPLRWQWKDWDGWDDITPEVKIKIVNDAKTVVTTLASSHSIEIPQITTLFDLLDATKIVQSSIEGSEDTQNTLDSIAQTLTKLEATDVAKTQT